MTGSKGSDRVTILDNSPNHFCRLQLTLTVCGPGFRTELRAARGGPRRVWPHCKLRFLTGEKPGFCCGSRRSHLWKDFLLIPGFGRLFPFLLRLKSTADYPSFRGPPISLAVKRQPHHRVHPMHNNSAVRCSTEGSWLKMLTI